MAFCPNCGTQVAGQFCPKCGTNMAGAAPLPPPSAAGSSGMATNLASALCYFTLIAIVFLLIEPYNKMREVRFHAWQSIGVAVGLTVLQIVLSIVFRLFWTISYSLAGLITLLSTLVSLGGLILFIFLAFKAYQNQRIVLPIIGPFAEKQA
jgi:uncharacterized membrane protein